MEDRVAKSVDEPGPGSLALMPQLPPVVFQQPDILHLVLGEAVTDRHFPDFFTCQVCFDFHHSVVFVVVGGEVDYGRSGIGSGLPRLEVNQLDPGVEELLPDRVEEALDDLHRIILASFLKSPDARDVEGQRGVIGVDHLGWRGVSRR